MEQDDSKGQNAAHPRSIGAALPTISPTDLGRDPLTPVREVVSANGFPDECRRLASLLAVREQTRIGAALPGLAIIAGRALEPAMLPARIANRLDVLGWHTWADVAAAVPAQVRGSWSIGNETLTRLFAAAAEESLCAIARTTNQDDAPTPFQQTSIASVNDRRIAEVRLATDVRESLLLIARWAGAGSSVVTLGELLAGNERDLPPDVSQAVERLRDVRLKDGAAPAVQADEQRIARLLSTLDAAERDTVRGRAPVRDRDTLDDLAKRRGLTRERVRQIEEQSRTLLDGHLGRDEFADVRWDVHRLRRRLGLGVYVGGGDAIAAAQHAMPADAVRWVPVLADVLFWLAGPYRVHADGWLRRDALPEAADVFPPFVNADGRVDLPDLRNALSERGLVGGGVDDWLERCVETRVIAGVTLAWGGTIADKLARVLAVHDEPAGVEELLASAGESHSIRSVRQKLMCDDRFVRTDKSRFGLLGWGLDEYAGLAVAIAEELGRRGAAGGELANVVATVAARFAARPASVAAYAAAPMFIIHDGRIRLRADGEVFDLSTDLNEAADVRPLGANGIAIDFDIDADVLRGSGRPTRPAVAAWAGVIPGGSTTFVGTAGEVRITWPTASPRPTIGSIRSALASVNAAAGGRARLFLDRAAKRWHVEVVGAESQP